MIQPTTLAGVLRSRIATLVSLATVFWISGVLPAFAEEAAPEAAKASAASTWTVALLGVAGILLASYVAVRVGRDGPKGDSPK